MSGIFIHRQVETRDTLLDLARRWGQKQYARFRIGCFAFHGAPARSASDAAEPRTPTSGCIRP